MKIQEFVEALPSLYDNWGNPNVLPKSPAFTEICRQVEFLTGTNVMQILNLAVKCLDAEEVYCEIGVGRGASFIAALLNNPEVSAYGIDNFSAFPQAEESLAIIAQNLNEFGVQDQVVLIQENFSEFFAQLKLIGNEERIGVYYYDAQEDYRSVLTSLLLVKYFLADRALIVIPNANLSQVQQAISDFIVSHDEAKILFDSSSLGKNIFDNGISILAWDTMGYYDFLEANLLNQNWLANAEINGNVKATGGSIFAPTDQKIVLHVGCGPYNPEALPEELRTEAWREIRLDIDPNMQPDVIGSITDLSAVPDNSVDAIYSSHNLEHIYDYEVAIALQEFNRVLNADGFIFIVVPDCQIAAEYVTRGDLDAALYQSPAGPVPVLWMFYGMGTSVAGIPYMAHKTGFTVSRLVNIIKNTGFYNVVGWRQFYNIYVKGYKQEKVQNQFRVFPFLESGKKLVLHVGCGPYDPEALPKELRTEAWREIRLDIDPNVQPDIIGSITDLNAVPDNSIDAIYSSHNLEHIYAHEVPIALGEFYRVLKPNSVALIVVPDIQQIAQFVADGKLEETLYQMPIGPIAALDVMYGLRKEIAQGNYQMAHKTAFTRETIKTKLLDIGFKQVEVEVQLRKLKVTAYR